MGSNDWTRTDLGAAAILRDAAFDARLAGGEGIRIERSEREFDGHDPAEVERKVGAMRAAGKILFDSPKARLASDPRRGVALVERTTYFAGLVTNDSHDLRAGRRVPDLSERLLSNHIGGACIAVDEDGVVPLVRARAANAVGGGRLGPSGSGSCDVADFGAATDLAAAVAAGLARETREEVGLRDDVPLSVSVVGFHRNLARGGKPEFVALARIGARLRDLPLSRSRDEQAFSGAVVLVEDGLETLHEWASRDGEANQSLAACAWQVSRSLGLLPPVRRTRGSDAAPLAVR